MVAIPKNLPDNLGARVGIAFEPIFHRNPRIVLARKYNPEPYFRIHGMWGKLSESIAVERMIDETSAGEIFSLGGDGPVGHAPTGWYSAGNVICPSSFRFKSFGWHEGDCKAADKYRIDGIVFKNGLWFQIGVDDAGRWFDNEKPNGDFIDLVAEFVLYSVDQDNWGIHANSVGNDHLDIIFS